MSSKDLISIQWQSVAHNQIASIKSYRVTCLCSQFLTSIFPWNLWQLKVAPWMTAIDQVANKITRKNQPLKLREGHTKFTQTTTGYRWYSTTCTTSRPLEMFHDDTTSTTTPPRYSRDSSSTRLVSISPTRARLLMPVILYSRAWWASKTMPRRKSRLTIASTYTTALSTVRNQRFSTTQILTLCLILISKSKKWKR